MVNHTLIRDFESRVCANLFAGRCVPINDTPFDGCLTIRRIGAVLAAEVRATSHVIEMSEENLAMPKVIYVTLVVEGQALLGQRGKWLRLMPGDAALSLADTPFTVVCPDNIHLLSLQLPTDTFIGAQLITITEPMLIPKQAGSARFDQQGLSRNLQHWLASATTLDAEENRILSTIEGLLQTQDRPRFGRSQYLAALAFIASNIGDPNLSNAAIAKALNLSSRQLSRIFSATGTTVAQEISERRLQRAMAALKDPAQNRYSVAEIGMRAGFSGAVVFSRSFRRRFGLPPGERRKEASHRPASLHNSSCG